MSCYYTLGIPPYHLELDDSNITLPLLTNGKENFLIKVNLTCFINLLSDFQKKSYMAK